MSSAAIFVWRFMGYINLGHIIIKNQALFSSKDKSKNLKCRLLQYLFGALWVKVGTQNNNCNCPKA